MLGFGYILPATFLPAFAREVVDDPQLFGLAWPVFGVAAALSTIATARRFGHANRLRVWAVGHLLMAAGVILPSVWLAPVTIAIAALLVGSTFMVVTMIGMQEAPGASAGQPHGVSRSDDCGFRRRSTGRPCRLRYARPFADRTPHRPRLRPAARGVRASAQRGLPLASFAL